MANENQIIRGDIISAATVYKRYSGIISSLISVANANISKLKQQIQSFKDAIDSNEQAAAAFNYLETSSYHEEHGNSYVKELTRLSTDLKNLETQWWASNNENSAHGGIQEYSTMTAYSERIVNPLHVIKNNRTPTYAADGRVNQSDFIGAYHFKNTIESLYAIATRLRDIYIKLKCGSTSVKVQMGQTNPLKDIKTVADHANYVTSASISANELSVALIPFHDWILNNDLNGSKIKISGDSEAVAHGWISSSSDPKRYPTDLSNAINAKYFLNKNTIGRQIVRNLRDRSDAKEGRGQNEPTHLSNFYYNDQTTAMYGQNSKGGIVKEYLSLKYGTEVSAPSSATDDFEITKYSTPALQLNDYFQKDVAETSSGTTIVNNVIRSKTCGKNHIVYAAKVNEMFRQMNLMLVQISSSLYGKYSFTFNNGKIVTYGPGNPRGGLAYPEVMSWYSGGTNGNGIDFLNRSPVAGQGDFTETYSGTLRNDSYVANEDDHQWESIRCGYPWITYAQRTGSSYPIKKIKDVYDNAKGSVVPMSYNGGNGGYYMTPTANGVKVQNLTNTSYFFGTSTSGKYTIEKSKNADAHKQVFTRYCISHPTKLSAEKRITAGFYTDPDSDISTLTKPSTFRTLDINAKYIFMPYMMYFDDWYKNEQTITAGYGKFLDTEISIKKPKNTFLGRLGMPVQALNRGSIWSAGSITGNYNNISVDLLVKKNRTDESGYIVENDWVASISTINYDVRGILTVNEVNHTHDGWSRLGLSAGGTNALSGANYLELSYRGDATTIHKNTNNSSLPGNMSSTTYYAYNDYEGDPTSTGKEKEVSSFYVDAIDAMFFDRYRFNDLYDDNDLLATDVKVYSDIQEYFSCGGDNTYLGGNKTMYWKWIIKKPPSTGSYAMKLYPYFWNTAGSDGKNMIQGNFFFSANHSDEMNIVKKDGVGRSYPNGNCHYSYVPTPNPVTVTAFIADPYATTNNIEMKGYTKAWWNNLAQLMLSINFKDKSPNPTIKTVIASKSYTRASKYPVPDPENLDATEIPFQACQVTRSAQLEGTNITARTEWDTHNKRFNFALTATCPFPASSTTYDPFTTKPELTYSFTNEDGGIKLYKGIDANSSTRTPDISANYSVFIAHGVHDILGKTDGTNYRNLRVGKYYKLSQRSEISSWEKAKENVNPNDIKDSVTLPTANVTMLGWTGTCDVDPETGTSSNYNYTKTSSTALNAFKANGDPKYQAGIGGWTGLKTKIKIPESIASQVVNNQDIELKITFQSIASNSGDGVAVYFADDNVELKGIDEIVTKDTDTNKNNIRYKMTAGDPEDWERYFYYDSEGKYQPKDINKKTIFNMIKKHFNNVDAGMTSANVCKRGAMILVDGDGHIEQVKLQFRKHFKVHKSSNTNCYIYNNLFFNAGGDSYHNKIQYPHSLDWSVFTVKIDPVE